VAALRCACVAAVYLLAAGCAEFSPVPVAPGGAGAGGGGGEAGVGGQNGAGGTGGTAGTGGTDGTAGTGGVGVDSSKELVVTCGSNVTTTSQSLPWILSVDPSPIRPGASFTATATGAALFDQTFLNTAQSVLPGGVRQVHVSDFQATVVAVSGATGPELGLTHASTDFRCALESDPGTHPPCDPDNDIGAEGANSDCQPIGGNNRCGVLIGLPVSDDCEVDGVCRSVGFVPGFCEGEDFCTEAAREQCRDNGFCVTGPLEVPLSTQTGTFVAAEQGDVRFGWFQPESWSFPISQYDEPIPSLGVRLTVLGIPVAIDCIASTAEGESVGLPESSELLAFPIAQCDDGGRTCPAGFEPDDDKCFFSDSPPPFVVPDLLAPACPGPSTLESLTELRDARALDSPSLLTRTTVLASNVSDELCAVIPDVAATVSFIDLEGNSVDETSLVFNGEGEAGTSSMAAQIVRVRIDPIIAWSSGSDVCCEREFQATFTFRVDQCEGW